MDVRIVPTSDTAWIKHDGNGKCPVDINAMVEVETYTPRIPTNTRYVAGKIAWHLVKFYRVVS
jgi:hypothetical protein